MTRNQLAVALAAPALFAGAAAGQDGDSPRLLFVRGADRSGGFLEANNDVGRTEQLADINNAQHRSTATTAGPRSPRRCGRRASPSNR